MFSINLQNNFQKVNNALQYLKRVLTRPQGLDLNSIGPVSRHFGIDRGTPIDRFFIEAFLNAYKETIRGRVLEIGDSTYTEKLGVNVVSSEVLHASPDNPAATIVGDLTAPDSLPQGAFDCFVCTQTFNFIYNVKEAFVGAHRLLAPNGIMLATVSGISQISRYDADRWGDYWRFTTSSARQVCADVFGEENVQVDYYGNCFAVVNFLRGISCEEIDTSQLYQKDPDYPLIITIIAKKQ